MKARNGDKAKTESEYQDNVDCVVKQLLYVYHSPEPVDTEHYIRRHTRCKFTQWKMTNTVKNDITTQSANTVSPSVKHQFYAVHYQRSL